MLGHLVFVLGHLVVVHGLNLRSRRAASRRDEREGTEDDATACVPAKRCFGHHLCATCPPRRVLVQFGYGAGGGWFGSMYGPGPGLTEKPRFAALCA